MKVLVKHGCNTIWCGSLLSTFRITVLAQYLKTEFATLPVLDLILKMDQKRLGLIFNVLPKDWKNDSLLPLIASLTSALRRLNFSFR